MFRPEFRAAAALIEDLKPFAVEGLRVDLLGPSVEAAPPPGPLPPPPLWSESPWGNPPAPAPPPPVAAPPPVASRLLLQGAPDAVARGRRVLHVLDVPRPAVLVSVLAAETRCLGRNESGGSVTFDRSPSGPDPAGTIFQGFASDFEPESYLRATLTGARPFEGTSVTLGDGAYEQVFRMLVRRNEAELLAWPTLVVTEGDAGTIASTVVLPQVLFERRGEATKVTPKAEETGIRLDVLPLRIGFEEALLDLAAWIRVAEPSSEADAPPGTLVLRTRQVRTRVAVRDRESLLVGGLRIRRQRHARTGLPLLQRIPVLDPLYSSRTAEVEETEILVLLRVRIMNPGRSPAGFAPPSAMEGLQRAPCAVDPPAAAR